MEDILIDTDVVIEYLRSKDKAATALIRLMQQYDVYLSSITEFELFLGARTDRHKSDLEMLFNEIEVVAFDFGCGQIAANIWKNLKKKHQHIEIKDIFIASIAINNDLWLCTFNKKHFDGIGDIRLWNGCK
jgi:tRNA(fMet)-specific endonuclease VapC